MKTKLTTPVAFIIFNRPKQTQAVFNEIKKVKPAKLLIVADGPRDKAEQEKCQQTRQIVENIDWQCKVLKNYVDKNMGCRNRVSSGISWVFEQVDKAIILEDDCVPHPTFFPYCDEMLEKYKDDESVMHIAGTNFQSKNQKFICDHSYYFSRLAQIWGWATWKRAWQLYDLNLNNFPQIKKGKILNKIFSDPAVISHWEWKFQDYYDKKADSWDGAWFYACLTNSGLCAVPKVNLITNIGYGKGAAHNTGYNEEKANQPIYPIDLPLNHPNKKIINQPADNFSLKYYFGINRHLKQKIRWFFKSNFKIPYNIIKKIYYKYKKI